MWERERIGRDIISAKAVTITDKLSLLETSNGEWVMERWCCIYTEIDGEDEHFFSINMYDGHVFYENDVFCNTAEQEFNSRLKIVEGS